MIAVHSLPFRAPETNRGATVMRGGRTAGTVAEL